MDDLSSSWEETARIVACEGLIFLSCLVYVLPFIVLGYLILYLKPPAGLASELGREEEAESWDRERRRRYGRHQHKHRHHRHRVSVAV
jgi:hypothetical protein